MITRDTDLRKVYAQPDPCKEAARIIQTHPRARYQFTERYEFMNMGELMDLVCYRIMKLEEAVDG